MKRILILGAGTAGTMMASHFRKRLNTSEHRIDVIDPSPTHCYQPALLFVPFGRYRQGELVKPTASLLPKGVGFIQKEVDRIDAEQSAVWLTDGSQENYDVLIVATGSRIEPGEVEGLEAIWGAEAFSFYDIPSAFALERRLADWPGGKLVVHVAEMPIKCPVAPLEFSFLAEDFFKQRGIRDKVEITYVTPLSGAFTKPVASRVLGDMLTERNIGMEADFAVMEVDAEQHQLVSFDERRVDFDLLVTIPPNMGDPMIERSGLGDDLRFVATDPNTLQAKAAPNIFVIGDATDLPTSKAGSVAHFQGEVLLENVERFLRGEDLKPDFDGHANCFVECGRGQAFLIDFNYEQEPVPGVFPFGGWGPLRLLKPTKVNHWGKLAFRWIYWHLLLRARPIPFIPNRMSMTGKQLTP